MTIRAVLAISILLLIVAIRTVFVGYDSYTPLVFAQGYIGLFGIVMMIPTLIATDRSAASDHLILLFVAAAVGCVLFAVAAPRIGEPNYCGGDYLLSNYARVPSVYRCTLAPFAAVGWFVGWWFTVWCVEWWKSRIDGDGEGVGATAGRLPAPGRVLAVVAAALMIVAVRSAFIGTQSFRTLAVAEIYVLGFTLCFSVATLLRTEQIDEPNWYVLYSAALVGAVLLWNMAPEIGEPNQCLPMLRSQRILHDIANDISRTLGIKPQVIARPKMFHCTSLPFAVVGGFAGWWIALWVSETRSASRNIES
jgi:hypothetical protein